MTADAWGRAQRVLAVRLDGIGDLLMTAPAMAALKAAVPGRVITPLVSRAGAAITSLLPDCGDPILYEAPWMKHAPLMATSDQAVLERVRAARFDAAVIFTVFSQSALPAALFCHLAGIPLRAAHCRENPYQLLTTWIRDTEPESGIRHEVQRQLDLVAALGAAADGAHPPLRLSAAARDWARRVRLPGRPFVLIHPGASAPSRRYPPESFARVLRALEREHRAFCVLTGIAEERGVMASVREQAASDAPLLWNLDPERLAALVECADVVVTNNTGPAHLAAALQTPVVVLYALTNPQHTPWRARARVLSADVPCRSCYRSICPSGHHRCLRDIDPRTVVAAVDELLRDAGDSVSRALC